MFKVVSVKNVITLKVINVKTKYWVLYPWFFYPWESFLYSLNVPASFNQKSCMAFKIASFIALFHHYIELFYSQIQETPPKKART